ncbi:MAG: cell division protein SepF [Candidatus Woesearchaeota archaeon]
MANPFANFRNKIKDAFSSPQEEYPEEVEEEYVELNTGAREGARTKIMVRPFVIEDFSDIKLILDSLRDGYTIALVNIKPLKDKDLVELKRAINKLKKTCDAIEGDIAGFGDDWIVVTPSFAEIYRTKHPMAAEKNFQAREEMQRDTRRMEGVETYDDDDVF